MFIEIWIWTICHKNRALRWKQHSPEATAKALGLFFATIGEHLLNNELAKLEQTSCRRKDIADGRDPFAKQSGSVQVQTASSAMRWVE